MLHLPRGRRRILAAWRCGGSAMGAFGDGLAQEEEAVWRHGGVDGREAWQDRCNRFALSLDRGMMEVIALATCGAHWECA